MKTTALVLLLLLAVLNSQAQKENNVWVGGTKSGIDFNSGAPVPFLRDATLPINTTTASICDKEGNLLFYTNGYKVYNHNYLPMQNGIGLEIGDYEDWGYGFNAVPDGALIIPFPEDSAKYYIFYVDLNYITFGTFVNKLMPTNFFYSVVDMTLAGGLGGILTGQKNLVLLSDTLTSCGIKAVKHGNGRDYWLIAHELESNRYYRFLIDPNGIHGPFSQHIGPSLNGYDAILFSTLHFNEEATMAAQLVTEATSIVLYDFDRCTGEFSNPNQFQVSDTLYQTAGAAFSPNGKYLYATGNLHLLWQFDLTAPDIFASRKLVAQYSGTLNPFPSDFYQLRLGPDQKIYVHTYNFNNALHVIHQPDSLGVACDFQENALVINPPGWSWQGFPNIVNYWLPALAGCDTITSAMSFPEPSITFGVYPNPFAGELNIHFTGASTNALVEIYDVLGQRIHQAVISPSNFFIRHAVDLTGFASGVYFVSVEVNGERYSRKVVKR